MSCQKMLLSALLFVATVCHAETITGRVVGVHDGDTITLLVDGHDQLKIRFAQIDAPELKQPYGQDAKQDLSGMVFGKDVRVETIGKDKYRRTLGAVFVGSRDVSRTLLRNGSAWVFRKYLNDPTLLDDEAYAERNRRGLWALQADQRIPPWEWRHPKK